MKSLSVAVLMMFAGLVQADESQICGNAIGAAVTFMTSTYGVDSSDVMVQVVSAKKSQKDELLIADVLTSTGTHKCSLKYMPAVARKGTLHICQWALQVASCDSPEVLKRVVVDEPWWVDEKASANAWRKALRKDAEKAEPAFTVPAQTGDHDEQ